MRDSSCAKSSTCLNTCLSPSGSCLILKQETASGVQRHRGILLSRLGIFLLSRLAPITLTETPALSWIQPAFSELYILYHIPITLTLTNPNT